MNKRCRLLLTAKCPNNCPLCCNKQFDLLNEVPIISRWDYDEFILTGGEPLQFPNSVIATINNISVITDYMGITPKFYLYTSICKPSIWNDLLTYVNGITYTVHTRENAHELVQLLCTLRDLNNGYDSILPNLGLVNSKSIRLNLFPEAKDLIDSELALSSLSWNDVSRYFVIKPMEWKENCPIPEGEDFRRLNNPW
jgi:hypothetical protein